MPLGLGGLKHSPPPALPNFAQLRFLGQQEKFGQTKFLQKFPCFVSITASHLLTLKGPMPTLQSAMDRIIDILVRRNGRDNFIFLLTCVIGSYDRLIGKNIFISCRPMLVYRIPPVPLGLFHKNLGNLQVFFFGKVVHSLTPPPPMPATNGPYRHP